MRGTFMRAPIFRLNLMSLGILMAFMFSPTMLIAGFQSDYDAALATFRAAKVQADYQKAASMFSELATKKEAGSLQANTLFWLAECYYGMKDYTRALNCFERVLLIPRSNKEEDSRYKVSICYVKLGLSESARWELTRFLRDFPSSSKADLVRKELNKLPAGTSGN